MTKQNDLGNRNRRPFIRPARKSRQIDTFERNNEPTRPTLYQIWMETADSAILVDVEQNALSRRGGADSINAPPQTAEGY